MFLGEISWKIPAKELFLVTLLKVNSNNFNEIAIIPVYIFKT